MLILICTWVEPMGYLEFNYLVKNSKAVITDSGGITEETTVMGIPCMTLRIIPNDLRQLLWARMNYWVPILMPFRLRWTNYLQRMEKGTILTCGWKDGGENCGGFIDGAVNSWLHIMTPYSAPEAQVTIVHQFAKMKLSCVTNKEVMNTIILQTSNPKHQTPNFQTTLVLLQEFGKHPLFCYKM
nr:UDP-N-acetylglucosamine 2-epimerase [Candidatus Brachybacter algidus]